jgi:hypothetical protein
MTGESRNGYSRQQRLFAEIQATQDNATRRALQCARLKFSRCALFDPVAPSQKLLFAPLLRRPRHMVHFIHGLTADGARHLDVPNRVRAPSLCHSSSFFHRWIDLRDPAQAIGFGIVRAGNECSADLGRIPAGYDTQPKRFFGFDMARRELLHLNAFGFGRPTPASNEDCLGSPPGATMCVGQVSPVSRTKSAMIAATRSR